MYLFVLQTSKRKLSNYERFYHLRYLIVSMLPFLKKLCKAQDQEIKTEAKVQGILRSSSTTNTRFYLVDDRIDLFCIGVVTSQVDISESLCSNEERVFW